MSAENPGVEDFLAPEEYPAWHPAAQGLAQDLPGESGAYASAQTATPIPVKHQPQRVIAGTMGK